MQILEKAARQLEAIGVIHAPIECEGLKPGHYHRFVTLQCRPGVYYIRGDDNVPDAPVEKLQLIFLDVPEMAAHFAEQIGWKIEIVEQIPTAMPDRIAISSILVR